MKQATLNFIVFLFIIGVAKVGFCLSGGELAEKIYNRYDGDDSYFKVKMFLVNENGKARERLLEIYTKDFNGLNKTYIVFLSPLDIRGTAFLSIEHPGDKDDTQYLFLPTLGRARRIVSSQKNRHFVNTDYTYEDMQRRKPFMDEHKIIGQQEFLERPCYILESIPKTRSQYSKRISWVDKNSYLILATDFYDKKNKKVKEFRVEKIQKIDGIWTPVKTTMYDLKRKHKTIMITTTVKYNQGLKDSLFTVRQLESEYD